MCSRRDVWICCGVMWRVTFTVTFSWTTTWCCITSCDGSDWLELMVHKFRLMPHQIVIDVVFVIWCLIKYTFFCVYKCEDESDIFSSSGYLYSCENNSTVFSVQYNYFWVWSLDKCLQENIWWPFKCIFTGYMWLNHCFYHNDCTDEQFTCISLITC